MSTFYGSDQWVSSAKNPGLPKAGQREDRVHLKGLFWGRLGGSAN